MYRLPLITEIGSIWEWNFLSKQKERHSIQLFIWSCLKEHLHLFHLWPIFQGTQHLSDKDTHWIFKIEYIVSGPNRLQKSLQPKQIYTFQTSFLFQYLIFLFSLIWIILQFAPLYHHPPVLGKNVTHCKIFNYMLIKTHTDTIPITKRMTASIK